jgi:hypothetical protein
MKYALFVVPHIAERAAALRVGRSAGANCYHLTGNAVKQTYDDCISQGTKKNLSAATVICNRICLAVYKVSAKTLPGYVDLAGDCNLLSPNPFVGHKYDNDISAWEGSQPVVNN